MKKIFYFFFLLILYSCGSDRSKQENNSSNSTTTNTETNAVDDKEKGAKEGVEQYITLKSEGAIKLDNFKKTNGYEKEERGIKLYVIEWEAQVSVVEEFLVGYVEKDNNLINTGGSNCGSFKIKLKGSYDYENWANNNFPDGSWRKNSYRRLYPGTTEKLTGNCKLQKTDNGWRMVEECGVDFTTSQMIYEEYDSRP